MNSSHPKKADLKYGGFSWLNEPSRHSVENGVITIYTDPRTDFWQQTYYGLRNDNAHSFLTEVMGDFTFSVKVSFESKILYDQCGIIVYQDSNNWIKASVEYENSLFARLGSVVTNLGFSDWATTDISADINTMWYRLSRRGQDFLLENSSDGLSFSQMRMFHLHLPIAASRIGIYACSPGESCFKAQFYRLNIGPCLWGAHQ
jgi:regulation of enolase protein 1 (concanavalin A-like superfamily)